MSQYITFQHNSDYFQKSSIFKEIKDFFNSNENSVKPTYLTLFKNNKEKAEVIVDLSIQLVIETIIKHNLNTDMLYNQFNFTQFLSKDNSPEVLEAFSSLKHDQHKLTPEQRDVYNIVSSVTQYTVGYLDDKKHNYATNLDSEMKEEFSIFLDNKYPQKKINSIKSNILNLRN